MGKPSSATELRHVANMGMSHARRAHCRSSVGSPSSWDASTTGSRGEEGNACTSAVHCLTGWGTSSSRACGATGGCSQARHADWRSSSGRLAPSPCGAGLNEVRCRSGMSQARRAHCLSSAGATGAGEPALWSSATKKTSYDASRSHARRAYCRSSLGKPSSSPQGDFGGSDVEVVVEAALVVEAEGLGKWPLSKLLKHLLATGVSDSSDSGRVVHGIRAEAGEVARLCLMIAVWTPVISRRFPPFHRRGAPLCSLSRDGP
eukprot:CAMPEP_0115265808 /NCGR_PEP_ID=MMETSP0270-20121206/51141_1 /TAXON_ID=71861 /ORGANISM="Scrippsiella trochoidea, Strain CCMP3099" /LENGTH=260 /DNA_ID=CAMNT_0002681881 /DNA_START=192 /DNA_END=971 /DNA_ORIENTATION=+